MESDNRGPARRLPPRWIIALLAAVVVGGASVAFWRLTRQSPAAPAIDSSAGREDAAWQPPPDDGYVGSAACAACHRDIADAYATHPMSRSIRAVRDDSDPAPPRLPPDDTRVPGDQRVLEADYRDGAMWHHEKMFDADGKPIYDHAVRMDYVVGSGRRAKAYLQQRGSLLLMSPLNWYTAAQQWDLAPGYVADDPRRFERRATEECLSCHAGRVAVEERLTHRYRNPAFHELSIGCENCHGPGAEHVALHESGSLAADVADPIVNPARLDHAARESVCYQCHLQAAVRLPRYGRSDFDFRPGSTVEEIWTFLETAGGEDGRPRAVSHVQQMHESRCYARSAGGFGCTSCHDPHRVPPPGQRVDWYRDKCVACHGGRDDVACSLPDEERRAQDDSCIACHMPARDTRNIAHLTQTDHRILRTPPATADEDSAAGSDGLVFYGETPPGLASWERDRALGLGAWLHLTKKGRQPAADLARFLAGALDHVPEDGMVLTVLGAMASDHQRTELARGYYEAARPLPEAEEAALAGLMKIHYLASEWPQALECADRLLEIDAGHAQAHALQADALAQLGRVSEGIDAARQALEFNPTLVPVREWLADAYRDAGREEESRRQRRILRRMRQARPPE